jgi:1,2-diacylglycerol 3-beta-glucosyltransferase
VRTQYPNDGNRRLKSAVMLASLWGLSAVVHGVPRGGWFILALTLLLGLHILRLLTKRPIPLPEPLAKDLPSQDYPLVSLVVSAKNEEAVLGALVKTLCAQAYPAERFEVWIVDDNSSDATPVVLEALKAEYPQLQVLRRSPDAVGGKSGALNEVLPLTKGEYLGIFDADAQVAPELLRSVLPIFDRERVGAVQVRKAIANASTNWLTRGQQAEMSLDAFMQRQRVALGGVGELRGNGQFIRRQALEDCGGWNESTITDDLDLSFRLHLSGWDIDLLTSPAVLEEGVTSMMALWHQRNRWAEGGYQRYFDYAPLLWRNRLGFQKTLDLGLFWFAQYLLPTLAIPDLLLTILRDRYPLFVPLTSLTIALSLLGIWMGLNQVRQQEAQPFRPLILLAQSISGTLYMCHWFPVMASVTARMAIRPKRLKWVKTLHLGQ